MEPEERFEQPEKNKKIKKNKKNKKNKKVKNNMFNKQDRLGPDFRTAPVVIFDGKYMSSVFSRLGI